MKVNALSLAFVLASSVLAVSPTISSASQIAIEDWASYGAPTNIFGANGPQGWTTPWNAGFGTAGYLNETRAGAVNYPGFLASGVNSLSLSADNTQEPYPTAGAINYAARGFAGVTTGNTIWGSFTYTGPNLASNPLGVVFNQSGIAHQISYALPNGGSAALVIFSLTVGSTSDTGNFYVNPALNFDPTSAPTATVTGAAGTINELELDVSTNGSTQYNGSSIGTIRFGTTAADVAPVVTSTVPEPASLSLIGLGAVALLRRRK